MKSGRRTAGIINPWRTYDVLFERAGGLFLARLYGFRSRSDQAQSLREILLLMHCHLTNPKNSPFAPVIATTPSDALCRNAQEWRNAQRTFERLFLMRFRPCTEERAVRLLRLLEEVRYASREIEARNEQRAADIILFPT